MEKIANDRLLVEEFKRDIIIIWQNKRLDAQSKN